MEEGVLDKKTARKLTGEERDSVDYEKIYKGRYQLLRKAYENSNISENPDYQKFVQKTAGGCQIMHFYGSKGQFGGVEWTKWAEDIRLRWENAMDYYRRELYFDIEFQQYMQFKFYEQWMKLKAYANEKGIQIIGDIPIYVAMDSADTWAHPELFQLDEENVPTGCSRMPAGWIFRNRTVLGKSAVPLGLSQKYRISWWISRLSYVFQPL